MNVTWYSRTFTSKTIPLFFGGERYFLFIYSIF